MAGTSECASARDARVREEGKTLQAAVERRVLCVGEGGLRRGIVLQLPLMADWS
jgi:hypothetical protein